MTYSNSVIPVDIRVHIERVIHRDPSLGTTKEGRKEYTVIVDAEPGDVVEFTFDLPKDAMVEEVRVNEALVGYEPVFTDKINIYKVPLGIRNKKSAFVISCDYTRQALPRIKKFFRPKYSVEWLYPQTKTPFTLIRIPMKNYVLDSQGMELNTPDGRVVKIERLKDKISDIYEEYIPELLTLKVKAREISYARYTGLWKNEYAVCSFFDKGCPSIKVKEEYKLDTLPYLLSLLPLLLLIPGIIFAVIPYSEYAQTALTIYGIIMVLTIWKYFLDGVRLNIFCMLGLFAPIIILISLLSLTILHVI